MPSTTSISRTSLLTGTLRSGGQAEERSGFAQFWGRHKAALFHKFIADVLDRVAEYDDFDPRQHYKLTLSATELTDTERNAAFQAGTADDVDLDLLLPRARHCSA